jgi:chemotaxis methyl-accepting protein methylase/chemotaxis signal transduction protein
MGLDPASVGDASLNGAIEREMQAAGISDLTTYLVRLRASAELRLALIEAVAVNETWFFRQPKAFRFLAERLRVKLNSSGPQPRLRLLSLACATGEEPYSMAMTLLDMGFQPDEFVIDALDISATSIAAARKASYAEKAFTRKGELGFRQVYFTRAGAVYTLAERVRRCVDFHTCNLIKDAAQVIGGRYDIIFCRHLLIYLSEAHRATVLQQLHQTLATDGTIFAGAAETASLRQAGFQPAGDPAAFAFKRAPSESPLPSPDAAPRERLPTEQGASPARAAGAKSRDRLGPLFTQGKVSGTDITATTCVDLTDCWTVSGSSGDHSCTRLNEHVHCRNCPTCIERARERLAPHQVLEDAAATYWNEVLARECDVKPPTDTLPLLVFRLGAQRFAIAVGLVQEITAIKPIHTIPYRTNAVLLGLANISGELRLCVSLRELLTDAASSAAAPAAHGTRRVYRRMLSLAQDDQRWTFAVDQVCGIHAIAQEAITPPTLSDAKATTYACGVSELEGHPVLHLDTQLLFSSLARSVR